MCHPFNHCFGDVGKAFIFVNTAVNNSSDVQTLNMVLDGDLCHFSDFSFLNE